MTTTTSTRISCDGFCKDAHEATMIGDKGYAYCAECGPRRRASGYERVRKMTPAEIRTIKAGLPLSSY